MTRTSARTRLVTALVGSALAATGLVTLGAGSASASDGGMFSQVNASRSNNGHPAYSWNSHLASVAAGQARRMANKHELYHNPNLASDVGSFRWVGENVGYGPNSDVIESAFMKSPAHRANILDDDFTQIGIASVRDDDGRLWVAQVFREPIGGDSGGSGSTAAKPKKKSNASNTANKPSKPSKPKARTTTQEGNATAGAPAPSATDDGGDDAVANPRTPRSNGPRRAAPVAPQPAPQPTLAQRVSQAQAQATPSTDPLADALAFAATMNAVAG